MNTTADDLNEMTVDQRRNVLQGEFGLRLHRWAASHVTYFWWIRIVSATEPPEAHNGTAFFLANQDQLYLVTAAHVYDGYVADRAKVSLSMTCRVANVVFDPVERLIDIDRDLDIATFKFTHGELREVGKQAIAIDTADWPSMRPATGQAAILLGYPLSSRLWLSPTEISFGLYGAIAMISTAGDRRITCPFEREVWGAWGDLALPPEGAALGGLSGGPLLLPTGRADGSWDMQLGGVIVQGPPGSNSFETVIACPAHYIRSDGRIERGSAPMRFMQLGKQRR